MVKEDVHGGGRVGIQTHKGAVEEEDFGPGHEGLSDARATGLAVAEMGDGHVQQRGEAELVDDVVEQLRLLGRGFPFHGVEGGVAGEVVAEGIVRLLPSRFISRAEISTAHAVPADSTAPVRVEADVLDGVVGGFGHVGQKRISPRGGGNAVMAAAENLQEIGAREGRGRDNGPVFRWSIRVQTRRE